jgi:hypothetical protein
MIGTGARLDAAAAFGAEAASGTELTLNAGRSPLIYGKSTELSGRLTDEAGEAVANEEMVLERRPVGDTDFKAFSKTTTSADGSYRLSGVKPGEHTDYRARFAGDDSRSLASSSSLNGRINVNVRVSNNTPQKNLELGRKRAISGAVSPSHAGSAVRINHQAQWRSYQPADRRSQLVLPLPDHDQARQTRKIRRVRRLPQGRRSPGQPEPGKSLQGSPLDTACGSVIAGWGASAL